MSELNKETSGSDPVTSGAGNVVKDSINSTSGESNANYEKLLREKKNTSSALQGAKEELESLKRWKADLEEADMLKGKEYEKVIENYKLKLGDSEKKNLELSETIQGSKKNSALLTELKKLGFVDNDKNRQAALKLINRSAMTVDPTTNTILGADDAAKGFLGDYGELGFFGKTTTGTNHDAPSMNINMPKDIGSLTRAEIDAMSTDDRWKLLQSIKERK